MWDIDVGPCAEIWKPPKNIHYFGFWVRNGGYLCSIRTQVSTRIFLFPLTIGSSVLTLEILFKHFSSSLLVSLSDQGDLCKCQWTQPFARLSVHSVRPHLSVCCACGWVRPLFSVINPSLRRLRTFGGHKNAHTVNHPLTWRTVSLTTWWKPPHKWLVSF